MSTDKKEVKTEVSEETKRPRKLKAFNYPQPDGKTPIVVLAKDRKEADNLLQEKLKSENKQEQTKE